MAVIDAGTPPPPADGTAVAVAANDGPAFSALDLVTGGMEAAVRDMAAGDEDLLALLGRCCRRNRAGAASAVPTRKMATLAPGKKDVWEIPLLGWKRAEVGIFADDRGALAGWWQTRTGCRSA